MFKIQSIYINPTGTSSIIRGSAKVFRLYKNPEAKDLFIKAQNTKSVEEREKLFNQMGDYDIVIEKEKQPSNNRFMQFMKGLLNAYSFDKNI